MIKRFSAILLVALLLCATVHAEESPEEGREDGFGFEAFDDGYDGSWVQVSALGVEFCLPEGWQPTCAPDGAAYAAVNSRGDATLSIRPAADNVGDLAAWGAANLKDSQLSKANFYDVLVTGDGNGMSVYLIVTNDSVISYDFTRENETALSPEFALQIVGSVCALWDDDVPLMDGDDGFDFGEAFEEDLG